MTDSYDNYTSGVMDITPSFMAGPRSNSVQQAVQYDEFSVVDLSPL